MQTVHEGIEAYKVEQADSIESLRRILADEELELVSYEDARALGYELMTFFEVFSEAVDESNVGT